MLNIILYGVEKPENLGSVARITKNFGFNNLVLVKPKCTPRDEKAIIVSKHARDLLEKTRVYKRIPRKIDLLIGTTAKITTDYNVVRTPITPEQAAKKIIPLLKKKNYNVGLLFGPESTGLNNKLLEKCDFIISIPTADYSTLNLSHAVGIILYEIHKQQENKQGKQEKNNPNGFDRIEPATKQELKILEKKFYEIAKQLFPKEKLKIQTMIWKRTIGKATLSKREAIGLMGFLSRVKKKIKHGSECESKKQKDTGR